MTLSLPLMLLAGLIAIALMTSLVWRLARPGWMGFEGKRLWHWLDLLAVPLMVGFATLILNDTQARIAADRAAEQQMQDFIDRISALKMDEELLASDTAMNAIGRAQTLAMLRQVEGERAGRVVAFLSELDLLRRFDVGFEGRDLRGAELKGIDLAAVDFEGADLRGADLERATFASADFEAADLRRSDAKSANLSRAGFEAALMKGMDLDHADLRGADLSLAEGLSEDQLDEACLDATTHLPEGFPPVTGETPGCVGEAED